MESVRRSLAQPLYKMATVAWHKSCGENASMPFPDPCYVKEEDDENFYGVWLCGIGMIDVHFPKATTRDFTEEEAIKYSSGSFRLGHNHWTYTKDELLNRNSEK
jgi:hypothetical protein